MKIVQPEDLTAGFKKMLSGIEVSLVAPTNNDTIDEYLLDYGNGFIEYGKIISIRFSRNPIDFGNGFKLFKDFASLELPVTFESVKNISVNFNTNDALALETANGRMMNMHRIRVNYSALFQGETFTDRNVKLHVSIKGTKQ